MPRGTQTLTKDQDSLAARAIYAQWSSRVGARGAEREQTPNSLPRLAADHPPNCLSSPLLHSTPLPSYPILPLPYPEPETGAQAKGTVSYMCCMALGFIVSMTRPAPTSRNSPRQTVVRYFAQKQLNNMLFKSKL
jgi:hypothetical protein